MIAAFFQFLALFLDGKGLSESGIGLVIAAMAVARIVSNPLWGHLADATIGRRSALQIGAFLSAVFGIVLAGVGGVGAIAVAGFLLAGAMVATGPNIDAITLEHLGADRMSEYGRIRSWESFTYAIGCLTLGWIFEVAGIAWAMPSFALASLLVFAWSFSVRRDRPRREDATGGSRLGTLGAVFHHAPRFWGFLAAVFLVWTGFNAAWNFIGLKIASEGGGPLLIGIGTAVGGLVEVPMMRSSSRLQGRLGLRRVYVLGCAVYALSFLLWGAISNPTIVSLLTVLEGVAFSMLFTTRPQIIWSAGMERPGKRFSSRRSWDISVAKCCTS